MCSSDLEVLPKARHGGILERIIGRTIVAGEVKGAAGSRDAERQRSGAWSAELLANALRVAATLSFAFHQFALDTSVRLS